MGAKKHTLYSRCCEAELEEQTGRCYNCGEWEPDPIPEPEFNREEEIEFLS